MGDSPYTTDNEVFNSLLFYITLLSIKVILMVIPTAYYRYTSKSFGNLEDAKARTSDPALIKKMLVPNDNVERVRRAHWNDLENIPAFMVIATLYCATQPDPATAIMHFKVFFITRVVHSISYIFALQPWRALSFIVGLITCFSMLYSTITVLWKCNALREFKFARNYFSRRPLCANSNSARNT